MSYRTKTCAYCYGNHSIMDCKKLEKDAEEAQKKLDVLYSDTDMRESIFKTLVRRFSYTWNREENTHSLQPIEENDWQSHHWNFKRYLGDNYQDVASENAYKDFYSTLPVKISDQQDDVHRSDYREIFSVSEYKNLVHRAESARKSKESRAKKSCSYCGSSGHTVRTCVKKKQDMKVHREAHKIACYYTARALSRFGFWTGSMCRTSDGSLKVFMNKSQERWGDFFSRVPIIADIDLLSRDEIDFLHLTSIADEQIYSIDWENNVMPVQSDEASQHSSYPNIVEFYRTKIDTAHIYNFISKEYNEPKTSTRKYEDPEILINSGKRVRQSWTENQDDFWYGRNLSAFRNTIFTKKKREDDVWNLIHDFVEKNRHILNKIDHIIVE